MGERVHCAGAVVVDDAGRLLLVRRGREPGKGLWSIPGGRVEPGETYEQAAVREVLEETGLHVEVVRFTGRVERAGLGGTVYVIDDVVARVVGGALSAGDDADEAAWFDGADLGTLDLSEGLLASLAAWDALGPGRPWSTR